MHVMFNYRNSDAKFPILFLIVIVPLILPQLTVEILRLLLLCTIVYGRIIFYESLVELPTGQRRLRC